MKGKKEGERKEGRRKKKEGRKERKKNGKRVVLRVSGKFGQIS